DHEPQERLRRIAPARAAHAAAVLAAGVCREREGSLREKGGLVVVVFDLNAVVAVKADATGVVQRVGAEVRVAEYGEGAGRSPQDLEPEPGLLVEHAVGLPAVDDPRLDLELVARVDLHA